MENNDKRFNHLVKYVQINLEKWKEITEFKDCPPLNKKVLIFHDDNIHIGHLENEGRGYIWCLENENGTQWVDINVVELWLEIS